MLIALVSVAAAEPVSLAPSYMAGDVLVERSEESVVVSEPGKRTNTTKRTREITTHVTRVGTDTVLRMEAPPDEIPALLELPERLTFDLVIGEDGELKEARGMDDLLSGRLEHMPDALKESTSAMVRELAMNNAVAQAHQDLPAEPVEIGVAWKTTETMTIPFLGELVLHKTCRLTEVAPDYQAEVLCDSTSEVDTSSDDLTAVIDAVAPPGHGDEARDHVEKAMSSIDIAVTGRETYVFDLDARRVVRSKTQLTTTMSVMGSPPASQVITTSSTIELKGPRTPGTE